MHKRGCLCRYLTRQYEDKGGNHHEREKWVVGPFFHHNFFRGLLSHGSVVSTIWWGARCSPRGSLEPVSSLLLNFVRTCRFNWFLRDNTSSEGWGEGGTNGWLFLTIAGIQRSSGHWAKLVLQDHSCSTRQRKAHHDQSTLARCGCYSRLHGGNGADGPAVRAPSDFNGKLFRRQAFDSTLGNGDFHLRRAHQQHHLRRLPGLGLCRQLERARARIHGGGGSHPGRHKPSPGRRRR